MKNRKCAVAGQFYPDNAKDINEMITEIYNKEKDKISEEFYNTDIIGGVVPHAGYIYSGYQAVHFFDILKNQRENYNTIIIVTPSHSGVGEDISVSPCDEWETPYGNIKVDMEFTRALNLPFSEIAQRYEHSGEVMLPFLKCFLDYEFKIVPIIINSQNYENAKFLAHRIYETNKLMKKKIVIIASSDFSHYELPEIARKHDNIVLEEIKVFNSKKVYESIIDNNLTICGYGPIITLMEYTKLVREEPQNKILRYGSSGDVVNMEKVVDYISILFY